MTGEFIVRLVFKNYESHDFSFIVTVRSLNAAKIPCKKPGYQKRVDYYWS